MKKILTVVLLIIVAGIGLYYSQRSQESEDSETNEKGKEAMSPNPSPSPLPETPEPSPTPTSPSPSPTNPPPSVIPPPPPPSNPPPPAPQVKTFNITGHNFAFSTAQIRVSKGDTVKINFQSTEGLHNWTLEGYGVGTQSVNAPGSSSVEFVADKAGTFTYYCSVGNHRQLGMVGTLIVE